MPKYWGKNYFAHGSFPEVGQKQKTEKKERKKKLNNGNNNGQLRFANANSDGARKAAWVNIGQLHLCTPPKVGCDNCLNLFMTYFILCFLVTYFISVSHLRFSHLSGKSESARSISHIDTFTTELEDKNWPRRLCVRHPRCATRGAPPEVVRHA